MVKTYKKIDAVGKFWQRNYHEHIIRNEESLNRIREYIINNPPCWQSDRENPNKIGEDKFDSWFEKEFRTRSKLRPN